VDAHEPVDQGRSHAPAQVGLGVHVVVCRHVLDLNAAHVLERRVGVLGLVLGREASLGVDILDAQADGLGVVLVVEQLYP